MAKFAPAIAFAVALTCALPAVAVASVELAANPRGDQVLLHRVLDQRTRPLYVGTRAAGARFGSLVPISATGGWWDANASVDDGGGVVADLTSVHYTNFKQPIAQTAIGPAGAAFEAPVDFSPTQAPQLLLHANASGDAIVSDGSSYRFRPRGSGSFGPLTDLPGDAPEFGNLVVDPDGSVAAFWRESAGGQWFTSVRPPNGEFGPPAEIAPIPGPGSFFVTARNGRAMRLWQDGSSIWAVERAPYGQFGSPFKIGDADPSAGLRDASLAPSGAAAVAFGYNRTTVLVRDPGGAFHAPRTISADQVGLAVNDAGDAAAVWVRRDHLVAATYRSRGGGFGKTLVLAAARPFAPGGFDTPGVAIDGAGTATAGWEESNGARVRTLVRDFNGSKLGSPVLVDVVASYAQEGLADACRPSDSRIIAQSARSTVFTSDLVYGCLLARGTPVPLTQSPYEEGTQTAVFAFAGPLVAYANDYHAHSSAYTSINVTDLRDPYSGANRSALVEFDHFDVTASFLAIRLKRNGAVAFIEVRDDSPTEKHVQVWNARAAMPHVVDSGRTIDPRTFKLKGSRLTWRHGKRLRHAVLR